MRIIRRLSVVLFIMLLAVPATAGGKKGKPTAMRTAPRPIQIEAAPPNDRCDGAIQIPCGTINLSGSSDMATNDYDFVDNSSSCTTFTAGGKDVVYKVTVAAGDSIWVDYTSTADGSIYIVTTCPTPPDSIIPFGSCVWGQDKGPGANLTENLRYKFLTAGTFYIILDSFGENTSGSWTLVGQLLCGPNPPPGNDKCETATALTCGSFNLSGTTQFANNDYTLPGGGCTGQIADGKDVVYRVNAIAGDSIWVDYTSSANGSIYIVTDCANPSTTCLAGADAAPAGGTEHLRFLFEFAGIYYIVLDSRDAGSFGTWNAVGALICANPPPVNDRCDAALSIHCGAIDLFGSTALATNDYSPPDSVISCTGFAADGKDVAYRIDASIGDSIWVNYRNLDADGSIYIVTDCANPTGTCVAGSDMTSLGETEPLRYKFTSRGTYYMILDSYDLNSSGRWTATGALICPTVAGVGTDQPADLLLGAIAPNPFGHTTSIGYSLPVRGRATLSVHDLQGRLVRTLVDGELPPGAHRATWDGTDDQGHRVGAGVYFVRLLSTHGMAMRRMVFVR